MTANIIFEQLDELYSRWSLLDKVGKEIQLTRLWQQVSTAYNYIHLVYHSRGYLTTSETNYANQLYQMLIGLQMLKMKVDQELSNEMVNHLAKMMGKKSQ